MDVLSLPNIWNDLLLIKPRLHGFDPYIILIYLLCQPFMLYGAHTHRNAMKRSIELYLLQGRKEKIDIYDNCSALIRNKIWTSFFSCFLNGIQISDSVGLLQLI